MAALEAAGLYERVRAKLVLGENVSQAAQFVQSGNAQLGILAQSLALSPALASTGSSALLPATSHPPILQGAVVIGAARDKALARQFLAFLRSAPVVARLRAFGFATAE